MTSLRRRIGTALSIVATVVGLNVLTTSTASAASYTFYVDDVRISLGDSNRGDGICRTTAGTCTLRAALEEVNTLPANPSDPPLITIDDDPASPNYHAWQNTTGATANNITLVDGVTTVNNLTFTLPATNSDANRMMTTAPYAAMSDRGGVNRQGSGPGEDAGAYFLAEKPVTIDFGYKLTYNAGTNCDTCTQNAIFFLNGNQQTLRGLYNYYSTETSLYVGPKAENVLITDGQVATPNWRPERYLVVRGGARNVALSYHTISGFASNDTDYNWITVARTGAAWPVDGLTVDHVRFLSNSSGSLCNDTASSGCGSTGIEMYNGQQYVTDVTFTNNYMNNVNRAVDSDARLMDGRNVTATGTITIENNLIEDPYARAGDSLIDFGGATINNLFVRNNSVLRMTGNNTSAAQGTFLELPNHAINGAVVVTGNYLQYSGGPGTSAIYWNGPTTATTSPNNLASSKLTISDNYFDWNMTTNQPVILLYQTGLAEVSRNIFSAATQSQSTTPSEESNSASAGLLSNYAASANAKLNTWYPFARTSANVQSPSPLLAESCVIPLEVAPPSDYRNTSDTTSGRYPQGTQSNPVYVDAYWTAAKDAELYLGRYPVWGGIGAGSGTTIASTTQASPTASGDAKHLTLRIPLPSAPITRINAADVGTSRRFGAGALDATGWISPTPVGWSQSQTVTATGSGGYPSPVPETRTEVAVAGPVNPTTGAVTGFLRLQTIDPTANSAMAAVSQFSRVVQIGGTCAPSLTLNQADGLAPGTGAQNDPTLNRNLHFTLTSSIPLDPATVTASDFDLFAELIDGTSLVGDPAQLGAEVVSVQPVPGSDDKVFDVVVRLNDSGRVTLTLGPGTVTSAAPMGSVAGSVGLRNPQAATASDNQITFHNPLRIAPSPVPLVAGEPTGKSYTISLVPGAPTPQYDLHFTGVIEQAGAGSWSAQPTLACDPGLGVWDGDTVPCVQVGAGLDLVTSDASIGAGQSASAPIPVRATDGSIDANTPVFVHYTLEAYDAVADAFDWNYHGLVVPSAQLRLFSTAPYLHLDIAGYVPPTGSLVQAPDRAVTDLANPGAIDAITSAWKLVCDTAIAPDPSYGCRFDRVPVAVPICFVYTATNREVDDWTSALSNVLIATTDTTLRTATGLLAESGELGTIARIDNGSSQRLMSCGITHPDGADAVAIDDPIAPAPAPAPAPPSPAPAPAAPAPAPAVLTPAPTVGLGE